MMSIVFFEKKDVVDSLKMSVGFVLLEADSMGLLPLTAS